jgi:hypothetical protein
METLEQLSPVQDDLPDKLVLLDAWEAGQLQPSPDTLVILVNLQRQLIEQEANLARNLATPLITRTTELISA